jgi:hypothetical protein
MLAWEWEHQLFAVHHLLVLCYHLQHPRQYSPAGLEGAEKLLVDFVEGGVSPQAMCQQISQQVVSGQREYTIKGTPAAHGAYRHPIQWDMCAADVTHAGVEQYEASVRRWADCTLKALRESGNLT